MSDLEPKTVHEPIPAAFGAWIADTKADSYTPAVDEFASLPQEMREAPRWLVWKSIPQNRPGKKPRKVPYYTNGTKRNGELDSPADQTKLSSFDDALRALKRQRYTGLGFALGPDGTGKYWQGIDLDDLKNRPHLVGIAKELPGYTEESPSKNGKHAIGYGRLFDSLGSNASGIEAYASGRFFTVTASRVSHSSPICLAEFVEQRLKPMHNARAKALSPDEPSVDREEVSTQIITDLRSALEFIEADDRDLWVKMGHALKTLGDPGRSLFIEWSKTSSKHDPSEDQKTWDSFKPNRTGYQAIFTEARRHGWINPWRNLKGVNGLSPSGQSNVTANHSDPVDELEKNIIPFSTNEDPFEELPHYVDKWIPYNEVTLLAGHGGGGKSFVALSIAVHVALGLPFATLPTTQTNVLFFSGEDGARVLRLRLAKICRALKVEPAQLVGKLNLLDASDIDPALHREQYSSENGLRNVVTETKLLGNLATLVQKRKVGLVVIDNASDTYDDDEIKRARVRAFIRSLRTKIARPNRAVLLLAHINKVAANHKGNAVTEDYSGSTAWHNSVRSRLSLTPSDNNSLIIEQMKANHGAKALTVKLEWHDGVPLVAGSHTSAGAEAAMATEKARDDADKGSLLSLIQDFNKRGERVTTSFQGSATIFRLLKGEPGFPKDTNSERLMRLLRNLESEEKIFRRTVRTPDRKQREGFTCAPITKEHSIQSGFEQDDVCANKV